VDPRRRSPHRVGWAPAPGGRPLPPLPQRLRSQPMPGPGRRDGLGGADQPLRGRQRPRALPAGRGARVATLALHRRLLPHRRGSGRQGLAPDVGERRRVRRLSGPSER
jgi:hypothetical protein